MVRAAGASAQVLGQEGKYVLVRLQSGEVRMILWNLPCNSWCCRKRTTWTCEPW